jgi:hypothetical protein
VKNEVVCLAHRVLCAAMRQAFDNDAMIPTVGPWLTFAYREAVFALSAIERDWLGIRFATGSLFSGFMMPRSLGAPCLAVFETCGFGRF